MIYSPQDTTPTVDKTLSLEVLVWLVAFPLGVIDQS
jgi:hypothetical protein